MTEQDDTQSRNADLRDLVDEKIRHMINEMYADGWRVEDVLLAVNDVIRQRWLARLDGATVAPPAMPSHERPSQALPCRGAPTSYTARPRRKPRPR
jgi:hypothetical protein